MSDERSHNPPRVAVLYSGGKDSNYALFEAVNAGFKIACLLSIRPANVESMLFHFPNTELTELQAESLGIPLLAQYVEQGQDEIHCLSEMVADAKDRFEVVGVVTGAVKSRYQMDKFGRVFELNGLEGLSPLWGADEERYLRRLVPAGFKAIVTRVAALGLGPEWVGAELDVGKIEELISLARRNKFNPSLEGGEGETFVLDMPLFKKRIVVIEAEKSWNRGEGTLSIKKAILRDKTADV
jgi:ABC transporter with metal-binding/Fe-S-binding domain ATP-binding protein